MVNCGTGRKVKKVESSMQIVNEGRPKELHGLHVQADMAFGKPQLAESL
jgi:hypothetical protein